jgi:8-oxo-dGTP pyrophosphatase MutT (NUDIX family)
VTQPSTFWPFPAAIYPRWTLQHSCISALKRTSSAPQCISPQSAARAEGAARETWEEAQAEVDIIAPYAHLDIPIIGQAYIFFRARPKDTSGPFSFAAGPESEEVALFDIDSIPFANLAFSSVHIVLKRWCADKRRGQYSMYHGVIRKKLGADIRDPAAFDVHDSFKMTVPDDDVRE